MKNKFAKLMGVVLTAMTVVSLFAFTVPASAAITPQTWTKQALPGATNLVMPNTVLASGLLTQAADGSLYMYAQTGASTYSILKSTNGGRAWKATSAAGAVTSLVAFGTNVYYTTATQLFRSTDSGTTYINIANVIGGGTFTSMDVAAFAGRNIILLGTTNNVYFVDEADPFFNLVPVGTPDFASAVGGSVVTVKAAPSFGTDRGVAAISSNGKVSFDVMGGAWGGIIYTAPAVSGGTVTAATIRFTSDWNSTTLPNFYFGISGGTAPGVYAFRGGVNAASNTFQFYAASATSTANVSSLAVVGTYNAATIYAGIVNDATHPTQLVYTTDRINWSSPSKLQSLNTGKSVYVVLDNSFAAATPNNTVYVLVGGTGLTANDQTGFYYSVDKGVTFNQISLINNTITTINDLAASSGTTFISTSYAGTDPNSAIPAGNIVFNSGSLVNIVPAVNADMVTITSAAAGTVIFGLNTGSMPTVVAGTGASWNPLTNVITFGAGGQTATITATGSNTVFQLTGVGLGVIGPITNITQPVGGTATINGADPNYAVSLLHGNVAATVTAPLFNNAIITLVPNPGANVTVTFNPVGGNYNAATGVITFTAANQTATVTNATGAPLTGITATVTYTNGNSSTVVPTYQLYTSNTVVSFPTTNSYSTGTVSLTIGSGTVTGTGTTFTAAMVGGILTVGANAYTITAFTNATTLTVSPVAVATVAGSAYTIVSGTGAFVLGIATPANAGTSSDSIWRWDGTNFERVFVGLRSLLPTTAPAGTTTSWPATTAAIGTATMVRVSSAYATDKTVFYAAVGGIYLSYSTDAGQTWKTQTSAIGSSNGTIDQIDSLLVVDGNTQYIGSNMSVAGETSRIVKSTTNGAGNILSPAWSEVILKNIATSTLTGAVTDIGVASNGDLVAVVTDPAATYVFKSTDAGATWKGLVDPNGTTDATLVASVNGVVGAFVDPAADYATTGNIFVTLNAGGVYRYSVLNTVSGAYGAAALGWLRVDGANATTPINTTNGDVVTGAGQVVTAGGPGSAAEGSGMVYATDHSAATQGVSRIKGLSTQAEALPGTVVFTGLWASSALAGNVQLWTIGSDLALWTYVDTLNVAGGAVVATPTSISTATVTWPALANATNYIVVVNTVKQNSVYTAVNSGGTVTVTYTAGATTAALSGLAASTQYFVSVWAVAPSSFIFGGATAPVSFTTPLDYPRTPTDPLVPTLGAANIPLSPNFAWNTVVGATSYTLQITAASDVGFASPIFNSATIPVVTGPSATFTYLGTLSYGTSYLWRVKANGVTGSDWVYGNFSTIAVTTPAVVVTQIPAQPAPTIIITQQPQVTITIAAASPAPVITVTQPSYTLVAPTAATPTYIWIIVGVGALLTLAVIILIIRTRRVV